MTPLILSKFGDLDVRYQLRHGQPAWVGRDVCAVLGIVKYRDALAQLDSDERVSMTVDTPGGQQTMTGVTEAGLWSLMLISRSASVKPFQRWLTHEVLPQIRRTGSYSPAADLTPAVRELSRLELIDMARDAEVGRLAAEAKVAELEGPADSWEHFASTDGDLSANEAAKVLSRHPGIAIGERRLWTWLDANRWTYRDPSGDRRPYQDRIDSGHLTARARGHHHPSTGEWVIDAPQVRIPMRGVELIRRHLVKAAPPALALVTTAAS